MGRIVAMLALAGVLLGGCGESAFVPSDQPAPTPSDSQAAANLARAGVLTTGDVPGYTAAPQPHDPGVDAQGQAFLKCLGTVHPTYVHRDNGTAFTNGQSEVDSSADVVATPAEAIAEVNAFDSDDAADCHRTTLRTGLTKGGATVTRVSYTVIPVTVRGSDVAFAYHIVLDYAAGTATTVLDSYTVQAAVGQTEITVTDSQNRGAANLGRAVDLAAIVVGRVRSAA